MDNMEMSGMEEFVVPQSLFEALDDIDYDKNYNYGSMESSSNILDYELDISSDTMASFMEMEQVQEVDMFPISNQAAPVIPRPSVIMKPTKKQRIENELPGGNVYRTVIQILIRSFRLSIMEIRKFFGLIKF